LDDEEACAERGSSLLQLVQFASLVLDLSEKVFERAREGRQVLVSAGAVPESRPHARPERLALGMSRR
jgi:hypothetical protein